MLVLDLSQKVAVKLSPLGKTELKNWGSLNYKMRDGLAIMTLSQLLLVFGGDKRHFGAWTPFERNCIRPSPTTSFSANDEVWVKLTPAGLQLLTRRAGHGSNSEFRLEDAYYVFFTFYAFMFVFGYDPEIARTPERFFDGNLEVRNPTSL